MLARIFPKVQSTARCLTISRSMSFGGPGMSSVETVHLLTCGRKKGDEYVINGSKAWITGGGHAKWYVYHYFPKSVIVTSSITYSGFKIIAMSAFDMTRPGVAAGALGISWRALDESAKYVKLFMKRHIEQNDDLRFLYSPAHAISRVEYQIHKEFSGDSLNNSFMSVTIESNDENKNLLTEEKGRKVRMFNKYVLENMTITLEGNELVFGRDVCPRLKQCTLSNAIADIFFETFWSKRLRSDPRIKIEYPTMKFFENKLFLPTHFYGVKAGGELGVESIEMVHLIYQIPSYKNTTSEEVSTAFANSLRSLLGTEIAPFKTSVFSLSILKEEMQKNVTYTAPFISLTILLLVSFTVGSCDKQIRTYSSMTGDWISSKPIEAMIGVLTSTMAIISAAGLLFALGEPFIYQLTFFAAAKTPDAISPTRHFFSKIFAPFLCRPSTRLALFLIYAVYIFLAFYGCSLLRPNLIPSRLVVDDSPLLDYLHLAEGKIWAEGLIGRVYVNNAPDFSKHPEQTTYEY
uniref:Acyl-CoA_dh_M domain-containing protein n=1 Tax=Heterorhabditis bacteriophora TaxID=37862 RepID=A0A1I7XFT6_HETBA